MPKVTLTFNLPEEQYDYECATKGCSLAFTLDDFDNYLRQRLKYEVLEDGVAEILQDVRDKLHEIRKDRDAYIDE